MLKGIALIKKYMTDPENLPDLLKKMRCEQWSYQLSWAVFGLLVRYLEKNLMANKVIPICEYSLYDPEITEKGNSKMLIDS